MQQFVRRGWRRLRCWAVRIVFAVLACLGVERVLDSCYPFPLDELRALPVSTVVTAADGTWLNVTATRTGERALPMTWDQASPMLRAAVLAGEDKRFFLHGGVDVAAVLRAFASNLRRGRIVSGASTITMQVVRMVEPRPRTWWSKIVEVFRARQLERLMSKREIATIWLSHVPMGGMLRGIDTAARYWFGRPASHLDAAAAAALVAMVPAPSWRAPHRHPERLLWWRQIVLQRMVAGGHLAAEDAVLAACEPLHMRRHAWPRHLPDLCDRALDAMVRPR